MHPDSRELLAPWWLDRAPAEKFVARQLRSAVVGSAHLVLGASSGHRSAVVQRAPEALSRTFGLREFARLARLVDPAVLPTDPVARAHGLIDEVQLLRGLVAQTEPGGDEVPDPMGQSSAEHRGPRRSSRTPCRRSWT
jgi:protein-tyrosine phosphatase